MRCVSLQTLTSLYVNYAKKNGDKLCEIEASAKISVENLRETPKD